MPVRLVDTAGLRVAGEAPADEAERQGIERSREALADADLVLLVHDVTVPLTSEEEALAAALRERPHLLVRNKMDLLERLNLPDTNGSSGSESAMHAVSALTGQGLESLRRAILDALHVGAGIAETGSLNTRRQQESVLAALNALQAASHANKTGQPHEIVLLDLHNALHALDSLTGETTADDIMSRIFSTFCIGK